VAERETEQNAFGFRIIDGRAFTFKVRQRDQALRTGR
jgi:hypothetical protein